MNIRWVILMFLLLSFSIPGSSEVLVHWSSATVPPAHALGIRDLVIWWNVGALALLKEAHKQGYRVYVETQPQQAAALAENVGKDGAEGVILNAPPAQRAAIASALPRLKSAYPKLRFMVLSPEGKLPQIIGMREPESLPAPPGDIRAYDVRTGKLRWTFHTIPRPGEYGYNTWPKDAWTYSGGANNWAGMALDEKRGIVYVPTGSAASDFYGSDRIGDDLFANCLIALNAETGQRIWHFQSVRHDLWDRDLPAPPVLLTVRRDGKSVDAVAQTTKSGYVFLFDRANGVPLFPVRYQPYPPSDVPGEEAADTQPLPTKPAPFARQRLTEDMLTQRTPEAHQAAVRQFRELRNQGQFVPFTVGKQTVVFPGFDGGAEWGGPAVDPGTGVLYVNANDVVFSGALAENSGHESNGRTVYLNQCAVCHGDSGAGSPPEIPSVQAVVQRRSPDFVENIIRHGKGRMPGFSGLPDNDIAALLEYFYGGGQAETTVSSQPVPKYRFTGYVKFVDPDGYPAVAPPWGTLSAIDVSTGEYLWKIALGEYPELAAKGMRNTGTENYGGPIVTAGGLVFIGATNFDRKFHAFDKDTGELCWEAELPFAGNATPATYEVDGRQYVVIAASGGKALNLPSRGTYVAFALPKPARQSHFAQLKK
jgi:quinoprotein glucose dehydrogenase